MTLANTNPTLSLVIPCFNASGTIEETLRSIDSQSVDLEIVIQDGGSTDGTQDVIRGTGILCSIESKKDRGQTDALNRAIKRAKGNIIGWINADDIYLGDHLPLVMEMFSTYPGLDVVYGDFSLLDENGRPARTKSSSSWNKRSMLNGNVRLFSGAMFFRKSVFDRFGFFDESLHYCMDFEYFLRLGDNVETSHVPVNLAGFRRSPTSKSGADTSKFFVESRQVRSRYVNGRRDWISSWQGNFKLLLYIYAMPILWSPRYDHFRARVVSLLRFTEKS